MDSSETEYVEIAALRLQTTFKLDPTNNTELQTTIHRLLHSSDGDTETLTFEDEDITLIKDSDAPIRAECEHGHPMPEIDEMFHELWHLIILNDPLEDIEIPDGPEGAEQTPGERFAMSAASMLLGPLGVIAEQHIFTMMDALSGIIGEPDKDTVFQLSDYGDTWYQSLDGYVNVLTDHPHPYAYDLADKLNEMIDQAKAGEPIDNELGEELERNIELHQNVMEFVTMFCASLTDDYGFRVSDEDREIVGFLIGTQPEIQFPIEEEPTLGISLLFDGETMPFLVDSFEETTDQILQDRAFRMWHMIMHTH